MNYKKILFTIIIVFCVVIECGTVYAMDRAIVVPDQKPTFKSLAGIPLLSLEKVSDNRNRWSEEKKQKIRQQLQESGEEKLLVLFNLATLLSPDLQKIIVNNVCNGKAEDIKIFFGKPMGDVVETYDWSYQVFRGEIFPGVKKMAANSPHWTPATIFKHSKDIAVFDSWSDNQTQCQDRKVLQSVGTVYEKILSQEASTRADNFNITYAYYAYRDSYTFSNFWKHQSRWQWILLPVVLFPFGVKALTQYCYPELSAQQAGKIVHEYDSQEIENAFVRNKLETTKDDVGSFLLRTKLPSLDEYKQALIDDKSNAIRACYFVPEVVIGVFGGLGLGVSVGDWLIEKKWGLASSVCVSIGAFYSVYFSVIFGIDWLGFALDEIIERPVFGAACATGCYAAVVSLWNVIKMRSTREDRVSIGKLSELLQRSDIEII